IDGMMVKGAANTNIVFVYYYRNKFDCLDTNLQRVYSATTIDSTGTTNLQLSPAAPGGVTRLQSLPSLINISACIEGKRLYIRSGSFAKNESADLLAQNAIIDVYSLSNGKYIQSLYAPRFRGRQLTAFTIVGDQFYGLYGHFIACFSIVRIRSDKQ
ncbi:MAG TPA: hypothetical protein VL307_16190, partial [Chitinophagaceae bacterium]|nr:hypothetical protein [Chitinophagaceae bacterium]